MIRQFLNLFKKEYQTLNKIEISKENLLYNYKYLSSLNRKIKIAPVVKSNGYGHGIIEIAKILDGKPLFFCVDSLYEAYELYKSNIKTPILIMGYTDPENFKVKKLPFTFAVFDLEMAKILNEYQPGCRIHIFVDTGMHREGITLEKLPEFLTQIKTYLNLKIEGLMSHLASADDKKDPLNKIQIKNFKKALEICRRHGVKPRWIHFSNSDGLFNLPYVSTYDTPGVCNLARVGLALYGISNSHSGSGASKLKPVLTLKSKIIQIKKLKKGDRIGYGGTFIAKKSIVLGVLPIGYYDGVDRRLSNKGYVLVDGIFCPIVGRVSMNITTIDLTKSPTPYIGQECFVYVSSKARKESSAYSNNRSDKNSIENAAKICKTIPYDILTSLATSTKRVIV